MDPAYSHLYAHVSILYWPYLWLQLRLLHAWRRETRRAVLISVSWWGKVTILHEGDAPGHPLGLAPAARLQWFSAALASDMPANLPSALPDLFVQASRRARSFATADRALRGTPAPDTS